MTSIPASTALLGLILGLLVAGIILVWRVHRRLQGAVGSTEKLAALTDQGLHQRATLELLEQRLNHLHNQFKEDSALLREQVGERIDGFKHGVAEQLGESRTRMVQVLGELREQTTKIMAEQRTYAEAQGVRALETLSVSMHKGFDSLHKQLGESLLRNATDLGQRVEALTKATDDRLREIGGQVDKRLSDGFEKTTATFADVIKRLALIDEAQKKITELSTEVVSLQELLSDKRARGAFGEVQLSALVSNVMPPQSYAFQHALPNNKVADCVLFMPEPTGTICIDAKFPLESYRVMTDSSRNEFERKRAEAQFKQDIKKHIKDISEKYVIRDITTDGAVMFIPAEAVFAEIHAHHPDLIEAAQGAHVWLASPTTLWAILNTASSVLKDAATRTQVDIIRQHLGHLADDFQRFRTRMDNLGRHIDQANRDVQDVNVSARKISDRFDKIERVELETNETPPSELQQRE